MSPTPELQTMAPVATTTTPELTALDRCDGCGARAYHRATLHSGGTLLFCHHHGKEHMAKLAPLVSDWLDESAALL